LDRSAERCFRSTRYSLPKWVILASQAAGERFDQEGQLIGITIHYRGTLKDLSCVEDFEDRLLDLALDLGGQARIWRSSPGVDPSRIVRGVILDQAPGQETTSLLISPEGWLIGLMEIEDAECGRLTEAPWCFVKTQFGPIDGHVALIEIFAALKREFFPDLEVMDEGDYWESRNIARLQQKFTFLQAAIEGLAEGLRRHGLSSEAAEDPEILTQRIIRIAEKVKRSLERPSEHPPPVFPDDEGEPDADVDEGLEAAWDELYKHSRRTQERFNRLLDERLARGEDYDEAFEGALRDAGLAVPGDDPGSHDEDSGWLDENATDDEYEASTDDYEIAELCAAAESADGSEIDDEFDADNPDPDRHPLLERASKFYLRLHELFHDHSPAGAADEKHVPESVLQSLFQGAGDLCGGLAQSLSHPEEYDDRGLSIVQLKRSLRGLAFARGALFNVPKSAMPEGEFDSLYGTLEGIEKEVFAELARRRGPA
jgi:hypothetical protein